MRQEKEHTSAVVLLIPMALCGALSLISVAMSIGAIVPAVGDAMGVDSRGVGGMIGYLFGALFFGGIGLLGLLTVRRGKRRDEREVARAEPVEGPDGPALLLPAGPGLVARWLGAAPLMVVTTVLPLCGQLASAAWSRLRFRESLSDFGGAGPDPTFWSLVLDGFQSLGWAAVVPGAALLVFLVRRTMFPAWPKTCLWLAVWVLGPTTFVDAMVDGLAATLPNVALATGLIVLNHQLGRLTLWLLSRPVAQDVVRSELDIPYQVPGSRARLRIRRDELRLDRLRSGRLNVHRRIRWGELRSVAVEQVTEPRSWQASTSTSVEVPAGPALRITGVDEEWQLPVTETVGEDLAAAIMLRSHNRT